MQQIHFLRKLSSLLHKSHETHFSSKKVVASHFSAKALTQLSPRFPVISPVLYGRIESISDPRKSIVHVLEQWVGEGKPLQKDVLIALLCRLRGLRRFNHALEVSKWMTDRRYLPLTATDCSVRLELIYKVHGIAGAENFFNGVSERLRTEGAYCALLNAYARENDVQKAEGIMQTMREKRMATSSMPYNMLINLYSRTGDLDKTEQLVREMERNGIRQDKYAVTALMYAYAAASNIPSMERILNQAEEDPKISHVWKVYSIAATGYLKVGMTERTLTMLRKLEEKMVHNHRNNNTAFVSLLTHYASIGDKDELYRVWNTHKPSGVLLNVSCRDMISCLSKLDDVDGAEKIFEEWESECSEYDFRVLDRLIAAYCRKGLFEKAESAVENAANRETPYASTWFTLAKGYIDHDKMPKAIEMLKKALLCSRSYTPCSTLTACLDYLEGQADVEGMEEIISLLENARSLTRDIYHRLLRTYIAAGKPVTEVLDRMKTDNLYDNEETLKILESNSGLNPVS